MEALLNRSQSPHAGQQAVRGFHPRQDQVWDSGHIILGCTVYSVQCPTKKINHWRCASLKPEVLSASTPSSPSNFSTLKDIFLPQLKSFNCWPGFVLKLLEASLMSSTIQNGRNSGGKVLLTNSLSQSAQLAQFSVGQLIQGLAGSSGEYSSWLQSQKIVLIKLEFLIYS